MRWWFHIDTLLSFALFLKRGADVFQEKFGDRYFTTYGADGFIFTYSRAIELCPLLFNYPYTRPAQEASTSFSVEEPGFFACLV